MRVAVDFGAMEKEVVVADDIQRSLHSRFVTAEGDEEVASFCAPAVLEDGMSNRHQRPPFIIATASCLETRHQYPNSDEYTGYERSIGKAAGLLKIGVNLMRLPPGERSSWPHAEEKEEEFVYVLEGEVDAWIDGFLHAMRPGDFAAFPAGTGICHCFINNSEHEAVLLGNLCTSVPVRV